MQRNPNLYQVVSTGLSDAIKEAGLGPGDKIPSERELSEQFGVSRPVIREAIRHLAAKGILEVRTGSGVRVATIGHEAITESIDLYLTQHGALDPDKITEVLTGLELSATELAATHATEDDLERLRSGDAPSSGASADPDATSQGAGDFHQAIIRASGNDLLMVLVTSLGGLLAGSRPDCLAPSGDRRRIEQHQRIVDALARRDSDAAVAAMADHLRESGAT